MVRVDAIVPLRIRERRAAAGGSAERTRCAHLRRIIGEQNLPRATRRRYQSRLGQLRQGVGELVRRRQIVTIGWALQTVRIFRFLLRGRGLHHPRSRRRLVFVLFGLPHLGTSRQASATDGAGPFAPIGRGALGVLGRGRGRTQLAEPVVLVERMGAKTSFGERGAELRHEPVGLGERLGRRREGARADACPFHLGTLTSK